jgi:hypothetical protein
MDTRIKSFNDYLTTRFIGTIDYATFRTGDSGIEVRGFYDVIGSKPSLVEKYKFNSFTSHRNPHRLCTGREDKTAHSSWDAVKCYGFKVPIGKIVVSPKNNIFVETKDGDVIELEYIDTDYTHLSKGFSLEQVMEKFEVVKF